MNIKFLVEYSLSELLNFYLLLTESFVYKTMCGTKQVAYLDERNRKWVMNYIISQGIISRISLKGL